MSKYRLFCGYFLPHRPHQRKPSMENLAVCVGACKAQSHGDAPARPLHQRRMNPTRLCEWTSWPWCWVTLRCAVCSLLVKLPWVAAPPLSLHSLFFVLSPPSGCLRWCRAVSAPVATECRQVTLHGVASIGFHKGAEDQREGMILAWRPPS